MTSRPHAEPSVPRRGRLRSFFGILGPGLVAGAADDDPSGIATYSIVGARMGTSMLWTALLTWPLMSVVQFMCARIGMVTGRGLTGALGKKLPKGALIVLSIALFAVNSINVGADLAGMSDAAQMLTGISTRSFVVVFGVVVALGQFLSSRPDLLPAPRMPRELTMLSKTLMNLDQVARSLDPQFDPNASIRRHASDMLRRRMLRSLSPGRLFTGALEIKEFAEKLPERLNRLIDAFADDKLQIRIKAIDEVLLMEGLQKVANRITLGLVISSLIVGAALLVRVETSFRILGYPGIPFLFFLTAGISALVLISNILLRDLQVHRAKIRALKQKGKGA
jgi:hypothetical protein